MAEDRRIIHEITPLMGKDHPKVRFDDSVLYEGAAAYAYMGLRWLSDHKA